MSVAAYNLHASGNVLATGTLEARKNRKNAKKKNTQQGIVTLCTPNGSFMII